MPAVEKAAAHLGDHAAYVTWVLRAGPPHYAAVESKHVKDYDYLYAAGAALGAVAIAALTLFGPPLRQHVPEPLIAAALRALGGLRRLHSGHIGDYIAWWTAGAAVFGGASLVLLR